MALNQKMREAINLLLADPLIPKGEIAKRVEVDPTTVTRWWKNPEFHEEWDRLSSEQWASAIKKAQKTAIELMDCNNAPVRLGAAKLVLDKVLADKQEISSEGGININVNIEDKDEHKS